MLLNMNTPQDLNQAMYVYSRKEKLFRKNFFILHYLRRGSLFGNGKQNKNELSFLFSFI